VLVVGGGYYLSRWLIAPLWLPLTPSLNRTGGHPTWLWFIIELFPPTIPCILAGLAVGVCLESRKPVLWACILGGFVVLGQWLSWHWHLAPDVIDRGRQVVTSLIPAVAAAGSTLAGWRRGESRSSVRKAGA
jgi:hypothetical protein